MKPVKIHSKNVKHDDKNDKDCSHKWRNKESKILFLSEL